MLDFGFSGAVVLSATSDAVDFYLRYVRCQP